LCEGRRRLAARRLRPGRGVTEAGGSVAMAVVATGWLNRLACGATNSPSDVED
jgi:hypothetical protein